MKVGMRFAVATLAASGLIAAGCGGDDPEETGSGSPEDTVESYIAAGQDGDGERVCELLTQSSVDAIEQFGGGDCADVSTDGVGDLPDDFEVGDAEEDGDTAQVPVSGDGEEIKIPVTQEDGEWKIDFTAIEIPDVSTGDLSTPGESTTP